MWSFGLTEEVESLTKTKGTRASQSTCVAAAFEPLVSSTKRRRNFEIDDPPVFGGREEPTEPCALRIVATGIY